MFRRSVVEILLPDSIEIGVYGGDTYFALASQAIGGSILIDKHVALYRRHGANGYSDMGVYGAATMAVRSSSSSWEEVAKNLRAHVQSNSSRFLDQIRSDHIERLLAHTAPLEKSGAAAGDNGNPLPALVSADAHVTLHGLVKQAKDKLQHKAKRTINGCVQRLGFELRRLEPERRWGLQQRRQGR
jgi:hypothetical protein